MQWDARLETGDEKVDEQHRTLVALFSELEDAEVADGPAAVPQVLDRLTEYTSVHFAMEEDLMRKAAFPAAAVAEHLAEHRALKARVREQVLDYRTGSLTTIKPVVAFLREWLAHHVDQVDRRLVEHCRDCGETG